MESKFLFRPKPVVLTHDQAQLGMCLETLDAVNDLHVCLLQLAGPFNISRFVIQDKHEYKHVVYNAKVNIYRQRGAPVYLGLQSSDMEGFNTVNRASVKPPAPHAPAVGVVEFLKAKSV